MAGGKSQMEETRERNRRRNFRFAAGRGQGALIFHCCLAAFVGLAGCQAAPKPHKVEAPEVAREWLLTNCTVGDRAKLEARLKGFAAPLRPMFIDALEHGPDAALLEEVKSAASVRFDQRRKYFEGGGTAGLKKKDLDGAKAITREQYISWELERFKLRYKSQAIAGLGILGGARARATLQKIAADDRSPLQSSAKAALKRMPP
jgi:hypothetical protein